MSDAFTTLSFTKVPDPTGSGTLDVTVAAGDPLTGTIAFYAAENVETMYTTSVFTKVDTQAVAAGTSSYTFNGPNADTSAYLVLLVDPGTTLANTVYASALPSDGVRGIGIASPYVSPSEMQSAQSAAEQYAQSLADEVITGKRNFEDVPQSDSILSALEALGFPNGMITSGTTPLLDEYMSASDDVTALMTFAEKVRRADERGDDTEEMAAIVSCFACRVAWGIAMIAIIVGLVALLIAMFAVTIIPGGVVVEAAFAGALTTLALSATTTVVVSNVMAGLFLAVGSAAGIGVMLGQLPRVICEATGNCPPAIGTWTGGDGISEIDPGPDHKPSITALRDVLHVAFVDSSQTIRVASQSIVSGTWSAGAVVSGAPSSNLGPTIIDYLDTLYLFVVDTSNQLQFATSTDGSTWSAFTAISGVMPSSVVSATVFQNMIVLAYLDSNDFVNVAYYNQIPATWSTLGQLPTSPKGDYAPAVATYGGDLYVAYPDQSQGQVMWSTASTSLNWSDPAAPAGVTIKAGSPLCLADCDDYLLVFYEWYRSFVIHWSWYADGIMYGDDNRLGGLSAQRARQGASGVWYEPLGAFYLVWKSWATDTMYSAMFVPSPLPTQDDVEERVPEFVA